MDETLTVRFETTGRHGDERFVREYVLDAIDRLEDRPECERVRFVPLARKAGLEAMDLDGGVVLKCSGDAEAILDRERDRWDAAVETGLAESWTLPDVPWDFDPGYIGEEGAALHRRLEWLGTRLSAVLYEELGTDLDPVDQYPGETREARVGVGWWTLLHLLSIQRNYPYRDEIAAYTEAMRFVLHNLARFEGAEAAAEEIDEAVESLERVRAELDDLQTPDRP